MRVKNNSKCRHYSIAAELNGHIPSFIDMLAPIFCELNEQVFLATGLSTLFQIGGPEPNLGGKLLALTLSSSTNFSDTYLTKDQLHQPTNSKRRQIRRIFVLGNQHRQTLHKVSECMLQ